MSGIKIQVFLGITWYLSSQCAGLVNNTVSSWPTSVYNWRWVVSVIPLVVELLLSASLNTCTEAALCVLKCAVCEKWFLCICGTHFAALCTQIQLNLVRLCCPLTFKFHFGNFEHVVQRQQSSKINLGGVLHYMCLTVFILTWLTSIQNHIVGVLLFQTAVVLWLMCSNHDENADTALTSVVWTCCYCIAFSYNIRLS